MSTKRLQDKTAIVTGGGQGIGLGIARAFAAEGARIVISGRKLPRLEEAAREIKREFGAEVLCIQADVGLRESAENTIAQAIAAFGTVHILVNNAMTIVPGLPILDTKDEVWDSTLASGLSGVFYHMQTVHPVMKQNGGGSVINICSGYGIMGPPGFGAYAATKEGVRGLSRVAAKEWGRDKIRVNMLNPAALTPAGEAYIKAHPGYEEQMAAQMPLGYLGRPQRDIGPVAVFLAGDESHYMTGQTINVDGGLVML